MIKQTAYLFAAFLLAAVVLQAQQSQEAPFAGVEKAVKEEQGGWAGNKERLSKVFADERKRLGKQFESELMKWLGTDPDKHYWASAFLDWEVYLYGNKRLPELSLLIKQQGLELVSDKDSDEIRGFVIGMSITAAILSDELGLRTLASSYKSEAERLLRLNPELAAYIPAVSDAERRRYDEIPLRGTQPQKVVTSSKAVPVVIGGKTIPPPRPVTQGGPLNSRAIKLAKLVYPRAAREARVSGTVEVQVLFDETGKVIWAKAQSGPPELRKVSEEAALQSVFKPVTLSGQPVKVQGVVIYNFVSR
jgi:hypothetical protein